MSLSQKIAAALDARPDNGALPCDVTVQDGPSRLTLHLTASGPVGRSRTEGWPASSPRTPTGFSAGTC